MTNNIKNKEQINSYTSVLTAFLNIYCHIYKYIKINVNEKYLFF